MLSIRAALLIAFSLFALLLSAQNERNEDFVEKVREQGPRCYAASELNSGAVDSVRAMSVRVSDRDFSGQPVQGMAFLNVTIRVGDDLREFSAFMLCGSDGRCSVECDGGSVVVESMDDAAMTLISEGFQADMSCFPAKSAYSDEVVDGEFITKEQLSNVRLSRAELILCQ